MEPLELLPCPFCGVAPNVSDMRMRTHWTGQRNIIISAEVMHWCPRASGELQNIVCRKAKTQKEAIDQWNTRIDEDYY